MINFINLNKTKENRLVFSNPGHYVVFFRNLSGKFDFEIKNCDINLDIYGLFIGKNKASYQVETVQSHQYPDSKSNLLIKGVFSDRAAFDYQGLIRIDKIAKNSHAYQKNQNLVLSKDVFVETKPYLEILNNDVLCTHATSTGGLNEEEKYYLMSRGLTSQKAEKLLINGFVNEIFGKIKEKTQNLDVKHT